MKSQIYEKVNKLFLEELNQIKKELEKENPEKNFRVINEDDEIKLEVIYGFDRRTLLEPCKEIEDGWFPYYTYEETKKYLQVGRDEINVIKQKKGDKK